MMFRLRGLADCLALALVVVALAVVFGLTTDHFFSAGTFKNIANQIPI